MPEHFETIHYHDVNYQASMGPFGFQMTSPKPPIDTDRTIVSTAIVAGSGGTGLSVKVSMFQQKVKFSESLFLLRVVLSYLQVGEIIQLPPVRKFTLMAMVALIQQAI